MRGMDAKTEARNEGRKKICKTGKYKNIMRTMKEGFTKQRLNGARKEKLGTK